VDLSNPTQRAKFEAYRKDLLQDHILFSEIIAQEDLFYAVDKLLYFIHFITPDLSQFVMTHASSCRTPYKPVDRRLLRRKSFSTNWGTPTKSLQITEQRNQTHSASIRLSLEASKVADIKDSVKNWNKKK